MLASGQGRRRLTEHVAAVSQRRSALIAAWAVIAMTLAYFAGDWMTFGTLVVPGDAAATFARIEASQALFSAGILCFLVVLILDVVVAWALHIFFKPVNRDVSRLAAWLRLVYAAMLGMALPNLVEVQTLVRGAGGARLVDPALWRAQVMLSLEAFHDVWALGLIVFGLHLLTLGYLALCSSFVPKILGVLLLAAGLGFVAEHAGRLLADDFDVAVSTFVGWGELVFVFWLLVRGGRVRAPAPRATAAAT